MKLVLYFLISSCLTLALFLTFMYLMTVVDPGLLELSDKAIKFRESEEKIELVSYLLLSKKDFVNSKNIVKVLVLV